ncbi:tyrosine-type recombinase/integrase [Paramicrobacterium agarici]|uniref:tyrosine-type recombinase/integrase n=1 Tax=Paramicrobacterium agarici TaxID=630514 RepID=UPI001151A2E9|nr:tyrosine-type recombinase/integrase [Microbacterium agarici]TQO23769.1 integrase/recombinase XerD [Microbacterium agarici]
MQWDQALHLFATYQRAGGLSEKTIHNRADCLHMLAHRSGREPLTVTKLDMLELLGRNHARTGEPVSAGTKQAERSYLQTFFHWLHSEGLRDDDPALTLPKIKTPRRKARPLRFAQIEDMLDSGAYRRTRDIITICALTGLRIGEVVKIRGEDVDVVNGTIRSIRKGHLDHINSIPPEIVELASRYPRHGWWFPSPYKNSQFPNGGGHILMKSASDRVSRAIRRIGITDHNITAHSLRHFYATTLLRQGVPIRVVQEMMGHASLNTTQLYAEVTEEDMSAGAAVLPIIGHRPQSGRAHGRIAA